MKQRKFAWYIAFAVVLWVIMFAWFGLEVALTGAKMYSEVDSVLAAIIAVMITDNIASGKSKCGCACEKDNAEKV